MSYIRHVSDNYLIVQSTLFNETINNYNSLFIVYNQYEIKYWKLI